MPNIEFHGYSSQEEKALGDLIKQMLSGKPYYEEVVMCSGFAKVQNLHFAGRPFLRLISTEGCDHVLDIKTELSTLGVDIQEAPPLVSFVTGDTLVDKIKSTVESWVNAFAVLSEEFNPAKKAGGYFVMKNVLTKKVVWEGFVGKVPADKKEKYKRLAHEKADRLIEHPEHSTSWESRDEKEEKYQGAIRAENYVFSFSGLSAEGDEAVSTNTAHGIAFLTGGTHWIFEITENKCWRDMKVTD